MSRFHSYLNTAKTILSGYAGDRPFALFLKDYFNQHKKHGSTDRKQIAHLCYCYFRLGKAGRNIETGQRIIFALYLCSTDPNKALAAIAPELNASVQLSMEEKLDKIQFLLQAVDIFPWEKELSAGIDHAAFSFSHLHQPDLFLRIRPGFEGVVEKKLAAAYIAFQSLSEHCIALENSSKIDHIIELNKEAVVQDFNSQRICEFFPLINTNHPPNIWDCCAASGGKSILMHDFFPAAKLTVSDIRKQIIYNLKKRFSTAGIKNYYAFEADLTNSQFPITNSPFDLVICDAPCSGSGTWGRTPEQLYFFAKEKIDHYSYLQKKISGEAARYLKPGGYFLYITCSVFRKENEDIIKILQDEAGMKLVKMEILEGYDKKADTLFAALLRKQ